MKYSALLFFFLCIPFFALAQCPTLPITITTQSDVNRLPINYPGCKVFPGITFDPIGNIRKLDSLYVVEEITGDLIIEHLLTVDLQGFDNLKSVGSLYLHDNFELVSLHGLENLTHISHKLEIDGDSPISSLQALNNVTDTVQIVSIRISPDLKNLDGLNGIISAGSVRIESRALETIDGFASLEHVETDIQIWRNDFLRNVQGFQSLNEVGGAISFYRNDSLSLISSFDNLEQLGIFSLTENHHLRNCTVFPKLKKLGGLYVERNDSLRTLSGFDQLDSIGFITIDDNRHFESLGSWPSCHSFTGAIKLTDNWKYSDLSFLHNLEYLSDDIIIEGSFDLSNSEWSHLDNVKTLEGSLTLRGLRGFDTFNGFNALDTVRGFIELDGLGMELLSGFQNLQFADYIVIKESNNLDEISGFSILESVIGGVSIQHSKLTNLIDFFPALKNYSRLGIIDNDELRSLEGLAPVEGNPSIDISLNDKLDDFSHLTFATDSIRQLRIEQKGNAPILRGMNGLKKVGYLEINSSKMTKIEAFEDLESVNLLTIRNNLSLPSLSSFPKLDKLLLLRILQNDSLTSIKGFPVLTEVEEIIIRDNPKLSECAYTSFCRAFENSQTITIEDNAPGCNSVAELTNLCSIVDDTCYVNYTLNSQDQVDSFDIYNSGCPIIEGNLIIYGNNLIYNLDGLSSIKEIRGSLAIYNTLLTDLSGLDSLKVAGYIDISYNPNLGDLTGLENLDSILNGVRIGDCPQLLNIDALSSLNVIPRINLNNLPMLQDINGLSGLQFMDHMNLSRLNINSISPLSNLTDTLGSMYLVLLDSLVNLDGVQNIETIGGLYFYKIGVGDLSELSNIPIGNQISLIANPNLTNLVGLEHIDTLQHLEISYHPNLITLTGLENLVYVENLMTIDSNFILPSLSPLHDSLYLNKVQIKGNPLLGYCAEPSICRVIKNEPPSHAIITGNAFGCADPVQLEPFCMMSPCPLPGDIVFSSQQEIDNFGLNYSTCTTMSGSVTISGGDITNLNGLSSITTISGDLIIENNANLSGLQSNGHGIDNLSGLNSLQFIGGDLIVSNNDALSSFSGLSSITFVGGAIEVNQNNNLISIVELNSGLIIRGTLTIENNPSLEICISEAFCAYIESNPFANYSFTNNSGACETNALYTACTSSSYTKFEDLHFKVFPSPATELLFVDFPYRLTDAKFKVVDMFGATLKRNIRLEQGGLDIRDLQNGTYVLFCEIAGRSVTRKFVVIR